MGFLPADPEDRDIERRYVDLLYNDEEGNRGLLVWYPKFLEDHKRDDIPIFIHVGPQRLQDIQTKGFFPAILIVPMIDPFEQKSQVETEHNIEINILSVVKGKGEFPFNETVEFAGDLKDLLMNTVPEHDVFTSSPSEGEIEFSWDVLDNNWLGISRLTLTYTFQKRID